MTAMLYCYSDADKSPQRPYVRGLSRYMGASACHEGRCTCVQGRLQPPLLDRPARVLGGTDTLVAQVMGSPRTVLVHKLRGHEDRNYLYLDFLSNHGQYYNLFKISRSLNN